jgi:hypothetical protein
VLQLAVSAGSVGGKPMEQHVKTVLVLLQSRRLYQSGIGVRREKAALSSG